MIPPISYRRRTNMVIWSRSTIEVRKMMTWQEWLIEEEELGLDFRPISEVRKIRRTRWRNCDDRGAQTREKWRRWTRTEDPTFGLITSHVTLTTKPHSKGDTRLSDRQTGILRNAETLVNATLALENCVRDNETSFRISYSVCISWARPDSRNQWIELVISYILWSLPYHTDDVRTW